MCIAWLCILRTLQSSASDSCTKMAFKTLAGFLSLISILQIANGALQFSMACLKAYGLSQLLLSVASLVQTESTPLQTRPVARCLPSVTTSNRISLTVASVAKKRTRYELHS